MLNAPSPPSSHSPLVATNRHSLDGVARVHVKNGERGVATFVLKISTPQTIHCPQHYGYTSDYYMYLHVHYMYFTCTYMYFTCTYMYLHVLYMYITCTLHVQVELKAGGVMG